MKSYWDASAILESVIAPAHRQRLRADKPFTRVHSLAEAFSTLTGGNLQLRVDADEAARIVENLSADLDFVDLTAAEVLTAFKTARAKGVRGGREHDYLHAVAAEKKKATQIVTVDENDFNELTRLQVVQL